MNINQHFEVIIKKLDDGFLATSISFPKCKGVGETQDAALEKLSNSIGNYISRMAKKSFKELLNSNTYSEVLFDHSNDESTNQKRVYSLNPTQQNLQKTAWLKLNSAADMQENLIFEHKDELVEFMESAIDHIHDGTTKLAAPPSKDAIQKMMSPNSLAAIIGKLAGQNNDGYLFGFPLSFN